MTDMEAGDSRATSIGGKDLLGHVHISYTIIIPKLN